MFQTKNKWCQKGITFIYTRMKNKIKLLKAILTVIWVLFWLVILSFYSQGSVVKLSNSFTLTILGILYLETLYLDKLETKKRSRIFKNVCLIFAVFFAMVYIYFGKNYSPVSFFMCGYVIFYLKSISNFIPKHIYDGYHKRTILKTHEVLYNTLIQDMLNYITVYSGVLEYKIDVDTLFLAEYEEHLFHELSEKFLKRYADKIIVVRRENVLEFNFIYESLDSLKEKIDSLKTDTKHEE